MDSKARGMARAPIEQVIMSEAPAVARASIEQATESQAPRGEWRTMAALALGAIALRLVLLGDKSFWVDEINSLNALTEGVWAHVVRVEASPPLFFLLLKGWAALAGTSHAALRLLSALLGGAAAAALYACARRWNFGRAAALTAGLWLAVHPAAYYQSRQNRYYALMLLLGTLWLATVPALLGRAPARSGAGRLAPWRNAIHWPFVLWGYAAWLTHYTFAFWAIGFSAATAVVAACAVRARRLGAIPWPRLILSGVVLAALLLTIVPLIAIQFDQGPASFLKPPAAADLARLCGRYLWIGDLGSLPRIAPWLLGAAGAATLARGAWRWHSLWRARSVAIEPAFDARARLGALAGLALVPHLAMWLVSQWRPIFIAERYGYFFLPAFILCVIDIWRPLPWPGAIARGRAIRGIGRAMRRKAVAIGAGALLVACAVQSARQWADDGQFNWRRAAELVNAQSRAGDALVFFPEWLVQSFEHNGGRTSGGAARVIDPANAAARAAATRLWLFAWEQNADPAGFVPLRALREAAGNPFVIQHPVITLSLIPRRERE